MEFGGVFKVQYFTWKHSMMRCLDASPSDSASSLTCDKHCLEPCLVKYLSPQPIFLPLHSVLDRLTECLCSMTSFENFRGNERCCVQVVAYCSHLRVRTIPDAFHLQLTNRASLTAGLDVNGIQDLLLSFRQEASIWRLW